MYIIVTGSACSGN